jgi:Transglycosylase SLT domain
MIGFVARQLTRFELEIRSFGEDAMSDNSRGQSMGAFWRKVCAALPAVVLIGGGITLSAQAEPIDDVAVSKGSPAIVVPDVALESSSNLPAPGSPSALPAPTSTTPLPVPVPLTPALVLPAGTVPGSSTPVILDNAGIPIRALEGYRTAVSLIDTADPDCNIDWALLAAIGRVESDHARFAGNQLDSANVAQPGIIGIPLDGSNGTARITDSDNGLLDRDTVYDRAVGPMQFIPSTWAGAGADADGDGVKNPQDMSDAAAAAAIYLCSGPGDLSQPADLSSAIMRYNASDSYVRTVIAIANAYRQGVTALPASDLPASDPPTSDPTAADISTADRSAPTMALTARAKAARPSPTQPTQAGPKPATGAGVVPPIPAPPTTPVPVTPVPATPVPVTPPITQVPVTPVPVTPVPVEPVPVTPVPATPVPVTPEPIPLPDPCLVIPDPTAPAPTTPPIVIDPTIPPVVIDPTVPALPPCALPTPTPAPTP